MNETPDYHSGAKSIVQALTPSPPLYFWRNVIAASENTCYQWRSSVPTPEGKFNWIHSTTIAWGRRHNCGRHQINDSRDVIPDYKQSCRRRNTFLLSETYNTGYRHFGSLAEDMSQKQACGIDHWEFYRVCHHRPNSRTQFQTIEVEGRIEPLGQGRAWRCQSQAWKHVPWQACWSQVVM